MTRIDNFEILVEAFLAWETETDRPGCTPSRAAAGSPRTKEEKRQ